MRLARRHVVILHDLAMVALAWSLGFVIRYDIHPADIPWALVGESLVPVLVIQGFVFWWTGLYRSVWRFASLPDAWNILRAVALGILCIGIALFLYNRMEGIPRTVLILYPVFLVLLLGGPRLANRFLRDHILGMASDSQAQRVLALGAGAAGEMLARDLKSQSDHELVGFLDDKPSLQGAKVRGLPVLGKLTQIPEVARKHRIDLLIVAMPSASNAQMQRVVELCEETGLPFRTLPRMQDLVSGKARFTDLQEVAIEDLLGRDPVHLDRESIGEGLRGRTVFVTGGGGSIGAELCRQVAAYAPARLVILEECEYHLFRTEAELRRHSPGVELVPALTDVRDSQGVEELFRRYRPDVVFHAAAYKHVPLLEDHAREAVRNNVLGTRNVAEAADRHGADKFVLISTDKAVNPTNVMGASKRVAEIFCQNFDARSDTAFVTVRFGNVLDSAGSVIPTFREQIAAGGPVTVTHPEITRYFMTIPEACQLILQAESMGAGGEIFVLEMGEPVAIAYLARQMIRLSGKEPERDIEIRYTGLRPGEKLFEELFYDSEELLATSHAKILLARYRGEDWERLERGLRDLARACEVDEGELRGRLRALVPEFQPVAGDDGEAPGAAAKVVPFRPA